MWNKQSLKQKRLQFSNLKTERGVINITVRDVVFCGMLLRCLSKRFCNWEFDRGVECDSYCSFCKRVLRSSYWNELVFCIFYVDTYGDNASGKCRLNIQFRDSHFVHPNGHSVTYLRVCIINWNHALIWLILLVMTQTENFCIHI